MFMRKASRMSSFYRGAVALWCCLQFACICNAQVVQVGNQFPQGVRIFVNTSESSVPECTDAALGLQYYDSASDSLLLCTVNGWSSIGTISSEIESLRNAAYCGTRGEYNEQTASCECFDDDENGHYSGDGCTDCIDGWRMPRTSLRCIEDIDECSESLLSCSSPQECFNTPGSAYCGCPGALTLNSARVCPIRYFKLEVLEGYDGDNSAFLSGVTIYDVDGEMSSIQTGSSEPSTTPSWVFDVGPSKKSFPTAVTLHTTSAQLSAYPQAFRLLGSSGASFSGDTTLLLEVLSPPTPQTTQTFSLQDGWLSAVYSNGQWQCEDGSSLSSLSSECVTCRRGQIGVDSICETCSDGYQPSATGDECEACPAPTHGTGGECSLCGDGELPNAERTGCEVCPDGTGVSSETWQCVTCDENTAGTGGVCSECPGGSLATVDRTACEVCPAGTELLSDPWRCSECTGHTYGVDGFCEDCPFTSLASSDHTSCEQCPDGTKPNGGYTACVQCSGNTAGSGGVCQTCPTGFVASSDKSQCVQCPDGTEVSFSQLQCTQCETHQAGTSGTCSECPTGQVANAGHTACESCPAGQYGTDSDECIDVFWVPLDWSSCSAPCDGGTQTRGYQCEDDSGTVYDNSWCASQSTPSTSQSCNTDACNVFFGVDNVGDVYVDGELVIDNHSGWSTTGKAHASIGVGTVIAVAGRDTGSPGGLIGTFVGTDGVVSGKRMATRTYSWKCTTTVESNWHLPGHSDSHWPEARGYGYNGANPWGTIPDVESDAEWIWSSDNTISTCSSDSTSPGCRVYCRFTVETISFQVGGDNHVTVYVDGVEAGTKSGWSPALLVDESHFNPSGSIVSLYGRNSQPENPNPAGLVGQFSNGVTTNSAWTCIAATLPPASWDEFTYPALPNAFQITALGNSPWGAIANHDGTTANWPGAYWIWTVNAGVGSAPPVDNNVWCRIIIAP